MSFDVDAIPSTEQLNITLADRIYHPYKKQIWAIGILFAVVVVAVLGKREYDSQQLQDQWNRFYVARDNGDTATEDDIDANLAELRGIVADHPNGEVVPFLLYQLAYRLYEHGRFDEAKATFEELQRNHPDFPVNGAISAPDAPELSLSDALVRAVDASKSWTEATEYEHRWPSAEEMLLLETNVGDLWLGFYDEAAPRAAAILAAAKAGELNGTLFHEIRRRGSDQRPQFVAVGAGGPETWADPRATLELDPTEIAEPLDTRYTIEHRRRIVTAYETPTGESSTIVRIVTADEGLPNENGRSTVLGAVMEHGDSLATLEKIALAPTYASNAETRAAPGILAVANHSYPYIYVRRATVWSANGATLADGHEWDTARAKSDQPEPFEADLPAEWKPEPPKEDAPDEEAGDNAAGESTEGDAGDVPDGE